MGTAPAAISRTGPIFLSHAGADTQAARQFAEVLRSHGLDVWFDKDNLQPGEPWMEALEKAIAQASAMIVYIGSLGIQAWVDREVRFGLVRNTHDREAFRFIPVLGEGADLAKLPPFVQQHQCVNVREPEHIRRLIELLKSSSQTAIPSEYWTTHSPFRSLQTFKPEDSWLFFGRDRDIADLLTRLGRAPTLAVIGNSGSGKSSLIQAGLIPALRRGRFRCGGSSVDSWRIAVFQPFAAPFDHLATALPKQLRPESSLIECAEFIDYCKKKLPAGGNALRTVIDTLVPEGNRVLLVVDQFEELFTLVSDTAIRSRYIDSLLTAARLDGAVPVHLVISLRADFYANCLDHPNLSAALGANLYNVPRIDTAQLHEAIANRLALAAARAEAGLLDSLFKDVGEEPGNLALLEHALGQLWEKSGGSGRTLTGDAYAEIGRLRGALGRHADEVYRELGSEADRLLAQRIFLELVQLGEGAPNTRRRVSKEALLHLGPREQVDRVIAHLASKRLVVTGENFVEVSHEALIREWRMLREWLKDNREDLRLGRLLLQAAEEWREMKRDPSAFLHGMRLTRGLEWREKHEEVSALLDEFLMASRRWEEDATRRERERRDRDETHSRELAAQAEEMLDRDQPAALDLAIRAWHTAKTAEANLAVAHAFPQLLAKLEGHTGKVLHAEFSPDGQRIVTASMDMTARVWEAVSGHLLAKLEGHTFHVLWAAFSPDCQRIVTASADRTARVWNADDGQLLAKIEGHAERVKHVAYSPDGRYIVTASDDMTARAWDSANGELLATLQGHTDFVNHATFSPNGQSIVTASADATARVWNASTGECVAKLEGHLGDIKHATFSSDGQQIVTASIDRRARVWNSVTGETLARLEGHTDAVWNARFSPDSQHIVTASYDRTARVWNATNGQLLAKLEGHAKGIVCAEFSPDGQRIVTASWDKTARVWNAATGQLLAELEGHSDSVDHAEFSPGGQRIVTASKDTTARVWSTVSVQPLVRLEGHTANIAHAEFSPDGQQIVTASYDDTARLWNAANGQLLAKLEGHTLLVEGAAFSPDGQRIVTASPDKTTRVWNANGQLVAVIEGRSPAFSPDGQCIASADGHQTVRLWRAADGQLLAKLEGHTDFVVSAAFSPDGHRIVTASWDHTARVWNATNGQMLAKLEGHTENVVQAEFSPDGRQIVTASEDRTAGLWNATTGQLVAKLEGHTQSILRAAFSPDGQRIVTANWEPTARVWSAADGKLLAKLNGHKDAVVHAEFSPDSQRIVTASYDGTARVWHASDGQLLVKLDGHTEGLNHAAFSPDGQRIVTASRDKTARVYRLLTLSDLAELLAK